MSMPTATRRTFTRQLTAVAVTGTLASTSSPFVWAQAKKIVIATGVDSSYAPFVVGIKKGIFAKNGIDADLRVFDDGSVALDGLITGAADIGATGEAGGLVRRVKGGQFFVVSTAHQAPKWYGIVATDAIKGPKDLEGRKVGLVRGSGAHMFLTIYAKFHKLNFSKIQPVFLAAPESVAALSNRNVDAICIWEPWLGRGMEVSNGVHLMATGDQNDLFKLTGYNFFSKRLLDDPDLAQRALKSILEASAWVPKNWEESVDLTSKFYKLRPEIADTIMKKFTWNVSFDKANITERFQMAETFATSMGLIDKKADLSSFLRPETLAAVAPQLVNS
jgi:ABC-type nitrate/sulfonate/bicarbonate transport system substrate-binding protein